MSQHSRPADRPNGAEVHREFAGEDNIAGGELSEIANRQNLLAQTNDTNAANGRKLLFDIFEAAERGDRSEEERLLSSLGDDNSKQEFSKLAEGMLANERMAQINRKLFDPSEGSIHEEELYNDVQQLRPRITDIQYLCKSAPFKVPAKPWTRVTDSDDLVSHLVSLYMTWGYPFYAFFCRDTFLKHMSAGNLNSDFCSPFLVNALLANACHYSDYLEAYRLPGDIKMKAAHFQAEAESYLRKHQFESRDEIRLSSLQASLLLFERYSLSGEDDHGYTMLHRAIRMAESLGVVNNNRKLILEDSSISDDMRRSLKRTAWGLFQVDTIVHMNFLKRSLIQTVNVDRISRDEDAINDMWTPYPNQLSPRRSYMSLYFDEACKLSYIARDTSWVVLDKYKDNQLKKSLHGRLREWEKSLPPEFEPDAMPAPYILVLRMRYHTIVINLCCHDLKPDKASVSLDEQSPGLASFNGDCAAITTAVSSAREIASLVRRFKRWYKLEHSHQFLMYAINVSLFCLMAQNAFDILDTDFLDLTKAFSIIACRSQVGRHLFHVFKGSVRSKIQSGQVSIPEYVSAVLQDFFAPRQNVHEPDRWDRYAERLAEVDGGESFLKDLENDPVVPSLNDMLRWYEKLSIGNEVRWMRHNRQPGF